MSKYPSVLLALFTLICADAAPAEVLLLDAIAKEPANAPGGVLRPQRGTRMDQVIARFGEPTERFASVGQPPITRWVYPTYTVYFEHELVLTSVLHR